MRKSMLLRVGVALAVVSACSGPDDASASDGSDGETALREAVSDYVEAFGVGDPDSAFALLSDRCARTVPEAEYRASVAAAGELYAGLAVDEFTDVPIDGDAVVTYTTDPMVEEGDAERWVREAGV